MGFSKLNPILWWLNIPPLVRYQYFLFFFMSHHITVCQMEDRWAHCCQTKLSHFFLFKLFIQLKRKLSASYTVEHLNHRHRTVLIMYIHIYIYTHVQSYICMKTWLKLMKTFPCNIRSSLFFHWSRRIIDDRIEKYDAYVVIFSK